MSKRERSTGTRVIIALVLTALILGLIYGISRNFTMEEETTISSDIVESTIKEAKELTTLKYHYKNVASFENSQEFNGLTVPFTTKRFIYTYEGDIHAGVDLDEVESSVDNETKTITVTLPEAKVLSHSIDEDSVMMFDEKEAIFNQLKLEDFQSFRAEEARKVEKEAIDRGILEEAQAQAETAVAEILKINPVIAEEYTIIIH